MLEFIQMDEKPFFFPHNTIVKSLPMKWIGGKFRTDRKCFSLQFLIYVRNLYFECATARDANNYEIVDFNRLLDRLIDKAIAVVYLTGAGVARGIPAHRAASCGGGEQADLDTNAQNCEKQRMYE